MEKRIILASQSPRRKQLLEGLGLSFIVLSSEIDEQRIIEEMGTVSPSELVSRLSACKAEAVAEQQSSGLVIGADTIVLLEGAILGKPVDRQAAKEMLRSLSGKTHSVLSGVTVIDVDSEITKTLCVETAVDFKKIDEDELERYLNKASYLDKAGAYAIQEHGALFVKEIRGCFFNVVGLPIFQTAELLKEFGVKIL